MRRFNRTLSAGCMAFAAILIVNLNEPGQTQTPGARFAAPANVTEKDFAGTWNWMFQDKRFATMTLDLKDNHLTGTVTNEWLNMNAQGRITGAESRPGSAVITRIWINNGRLSIVEKTASDEFKWAMRLTSPTTAELSIVDAGAPANAEPIRLEKVWSEPPVAQ